MTKIEELKKFEKNEKNWKHLKKLQCIRFRLENIKYKEIKTLLWISEDTIARWVKKYNNWWIKWLLETNDNWRKSKLSEADITKIKEENEKKWFNNAEESQAYIEKEFWIKFCISHVRTILKKTKF